MRSRFTRLLIAIILTALTLFPLVAEAAGPTANPTQGNSLSRTQFPKTYTHHKKPRSVLTDTWNWVDYNNELPSNFVYGLFLSQYEFTSALSVAAVPGAQGSAYFSGYIGGYDPVYNYFEVGLKDSYHYDAQGNWNGSQWYFLSGQQVTCQTGRWFSQGNYQGCIGAYGDTPLSPGAFKMGVYKPGSSLYWGVYFVDTNGVYDIMGTIDNPNTVLGTPTLTIEEAYDPAVYSSNPWPTIFGEFMDPQLGYWQKGLLLWPNSNYLCIDCAVQDAFILTWTGNPLDGTNGCKGNMCFLHGSPLMPDPFVWYVISSNLVYSGDVPWEQCASLGWF